MGRVKVVVRNQHQSVVAIGQVLEQILYPLDPIPVAPAPGKFADNGVSELLAMSGGGLLALERSGTQGADGVPDVLILVGRAVGHG